MKHQGSEGKHRKAWLVVYPFKDFGGTAANQIEEETEAK